MTTGAAGRGARTAWAAALLVGSWFGLIGLKTAGAQTPADSSLTEEAMQGPVGPPKKADPADPARQVAELREQIRQLQASLALADADAEAFRRQWQDLRLRNQALGIDALTNDEKRLQDRVVEAVKELYQSEQELRNAVNRLQQLLVAGQEVLKGAEKIDPQRRADYEIAVRAARDFLDTRNRSDIPAPQDATHGQLVHVNGDLGAVIVNLGGAAGVKPGMPFRVLRQESDGKEREIARLRAIEVRDLVCAALVESVEKGTDLKIGDRVAVAAEK